MILGFFRRRDANADIVQRLYERVATAARDPSLFGALGVPDTVEGRFEMVALHAHLVVRRLRSLPDPGGDLAQDLVDIIFRHFDAALRELGVGDISVPKRMKTMASAFLGRGKGYEQSLAAGELLQALHRNVYALSPERHIQAEDLADYVRRAIAALDGLGFEDFVEGRVVFPQPLSPPRLKGRP